MPNVIIEVSHDHLISQPDSLLARVNDTLWQSGNFKLQSDIKSRIYYPNHVLVGLTDSGDEAFIMAHFYLMPGRDDATIQSLAQRIADAIKAHCRCYQSASAGIRKSGACWQFADLRQFHYSKH